MGETQRLERGEPLRESGKAREVDATAREREAAHAAGAAEPVWVRHGGIPVRDGDGVEAAQGAQSGEVVPLVCGVFATEREPAEGGVEGRLGGGACDVGEEGLEDFGRAGEIEVDAVEEVIAAGGQPGFANEAAGSEGGHIIVQVVDYCVSELWREGLSMGCHDWSWGFLVNLNKNRTTSTHMPQKHSQCTVRFDDCIHVHIDGRPFWVVFAAYW